MGAWLESDMPQYSHAAANLSIVYGRNWVYGRNIANPNNISPAPTTKYCVPSNS